MSLNARFLKDPLEFARRYALNPQGNFKSTKEKDLGGGDTFYQVQGAHRIMYCAIVQGGIENDDAAMRTDTRQDGNLCRMEFSPSSQTSSAFPVFWLPWAKDKATRIMLKTSKHETRTTGFFNPKSLEPRVFVTAALSGCSVFVEGDRDQPIVYHLNANATAMGAIDLTDPTLLTRTNIKMKTMEARYAAISTSAAHGKVALGKQGATSVNMSTYMKPEIHPHAAAERLERAREQLQVNRDLPDLKGTRNVKKVGDAQTLATFGTVFGKKADDGLWTFYFQSRTRAEFWTKRDPTGADDDYENWQRAHRWVSINCHEFWPNGARSIHR